MKRLALALALIPSALSAADALQEAAAWSPLPTRDDGLHAAEQRPLEEHGGRMFVQGLALAATADRIGAGILRERDGEECWDAQVVLGYAEVEHGHDNQAMFLPTFASRSGVYLRVGTDAQAGDAGVPLVAAGVAVCTSWGGGPWLAWAEGGWSDERGGLFTGEVACAFLPSHVAFDHDDDVDRLRVGFCLRWPGGPLARTPGDDPCSFLLALDWCRVDTDAADISGFFGELAIGWRFAPHLFVHGQVSGTDTAIGGDGARSTAVNAALGLGIVF